MTGFLSDRKFPHHACIENRQLPFPLFVEAVLLRPVVR
jgi:hypothetical protein